MATLRERTRRADDQPFALKPVALLTAAPGPLGGKRVQYDLRKVLLSMNALVLAKPEVLIGGATTKFDAASGACTDETKRKFVSDPMQALQRWIDGCRRLRAAA